MWAVMCVCHHVCHTQARSCLSTGWALNRCFAWVFGTAAVLAQGGGGVRGDDGPSSNGRCLFKHGDGSCTVVEFVGVLLDGVAYLQQHTVQTGSMWSVTHWVATTCLFGELLEHSQRSARCATTWPGAKAKVSGVYHAPNELFKYCCILQCGCCPFHYR
jgi:hypothetical protein